MMRSMLSVVAKCVQIKSTNVSTLSLVSVYAAENANVVEAKVKQSETVGSMQSTNTGWCAGETEFGQCRHCMVWICLQTHTGWSCYGNESAGEAGSGLAASATRTACLSRDLAPSHHF